MEAKYYKVNEELPVFDPESLVDCTIYEKGKLDGIKEVVDWIEQYEKSSCKGVFVMPVDVWQAKLKEWGIEK